MRRPFPALGLVLLLVGTACGDHSSTQPSSTAAQTVVGPAADGGGARTANSSPILVVRTTPVANNATVPYPTVSGLVPLTVRFNLCRSDDPEQILLPNGTFDPTGDTITWQFHFGDSDRPAFNPNGTFNPDFEHFCRVDHVYYRPGSYTATLSVTDKHMEDQSRGVSALARVTTRLTIEALLPPPPSPASPTPTPASPPVILTFTQSWGCFPPGYTLTWTTSGATSASIDKGVGAVAVNGSRFLASPPFNDDTYTLTVTGAGGTATRGVAAVNTGC
jgi:hypothetical protein